MTEEMKAMIELVNKALANTGESKIKEVLDFLGYKEDSKFIPKYGEQYYVITTFGSVSVSGWRDDKHDNYVLLMNNVYRTEEEAEQALDFQTRKANLLKEIEDSSDAIDWDDGNQFKYTIYYDNSRGSLEYTYWSTVQYGEVTYTTDKLFLEELIKERSDEVKELLFDNK